MFSTWTSSVAVRRIGTQRQRIARVAVTSCFHLAVRSPRVAWLGRSAVMSAWVLRRQGGWLTSSRSSANSTGTGEARMRCRAAGCRWRAFKQTAAPTDVLMSPSSTLAGEGDHNLLPGA